MPANTFTPPQLAKLFKVNVSTIKRWVDKGYLVSNKTPGGHRRISRAQLRAFIRKYPQHSHNSYVLKRYTRQKTKIKKDGWKTYYAYIISEKNNKAFSYLEKSFVSGITISRIIKDFINPTLRHINTLHEQSQLSVYQVHRMQFQIRQHITQLNYLIIDEVPDKAPTALIACAPGEYYELPLQILALILKSHGWNPIVLGINISVDELLQAARDIKPNMIIPIRTYAVKNSTAYYNKLASYADKNNICIALGGPAWRKRVERNIKNCWTSRKIVTFFNKMDDFEIYLEELKR